MNSITERPGIGAAPASLAIDNLRAVVILLVLAFHSVLAYLNFLPQHPFAFDEAPYLWRSFPIVDGQRWMGFDLFCAWLDVFLMSFFFLVSGLFAWPSLCRKGVVAFLQDRILRLGLPFAVIVLVLMPIALYPSYLQTAPDPSLAGYWQHWRNLPFWPCGPVWFLWLLLAGDVLIALVFQLLQGRREMVRQLSVFARRHPERFLGWFFLVSVIAYLPLALIFGPSDWAQRGPFAFQLSRPLHYALYLMAGVAIGACGIERGLLAADGAIARRWAWLSVPAAVLLFVWMGLTGWSMSYAGNAPIWLQTAADLGFVAACCANTFFVLGAAIHFGRCRTAILDSLKINAYGMYLIHYAFIVWLQYALLGFGWPAVLKATIVFTGALLLSWTATAAARRQTLVASIIGAERKPRAPRPIPATSPQAPGLVR